MIEGMMIGFNTAFSGYNILMVMMGCFAGTIIGMLPGLGPMSAIALMIPITYGFDPASAMILMAGVYYGAIFGGSTSSILINAPGVAGTVSSSFDGYPMSQKGQAGKALAIAAYASFSGGTIAALFLLVAAPQLAKVSLSFQSADYFALMCVGLLSIAAFASKGQFLKAMIMTALGLALATVGQDSLSDITRFAFGNINLMDGISFVLLVMATFAMSEAFMIIFKKMDINFKSSDVSKSSLGSIKISKDEVKEMVPTIGRTSVLGFFVGVLPGAGATIASSVNIGKNCIIGGRSFISDHVTIGDNSIIGAGVDVMQSLIDRQHTFDLIFIDADKNNYPNYYELSLNLVPSNGIIIIDNMLWHGDVADLSKNDSQTKTIRDLNLQINQDDRVEFSLLPLSDGLSFIRKK